MNLVQIVCGKLLNAGITLMHKALAIFYIRNLIVFMFKNIITIQNYIRNLNIFISKILLRYNSFTITYSSGISAGRCTGSSSTSNDVSGIRPGSNSRNGSTLAAGASGTSSWRGRLRGGGGLGGGLPTSWIELSLHAEQVHSICSPRCLLRYICRYCAGVTPENKDQRI